MIAKVFVSLLAGLSSAAVIQGPLRREAPTEYDSNNARRACSELRRSFPNNYIDVSSGANYTAKINFNWALNCDLPAACIFTPTSTPDVAKGLSIVTRNNARFAIRNGGHNPNVGFASIVGGVLFDMSGMSSISINSDQTIVTAGSGNTGGSLQKYTNAIGKSLVTGIDLPPGITGLSTLGGFTHFTQLNGLPADNVVDFEIVLGDSSVTHANATYNTDLYRALRGGGNNFGIVTSLKLRTSVVNKMWFTSFDLDPKGYVKYMKAIREAHAGIEKDPKASFEALAAPSMFRLILWYADHVAAPAVFAPLLEFLPSAHVVSPPTNSTVYDTMVQSSSHLPSSYLVLNSVVHKPDADLSIGLFTRLLNESMTTGNTTTLALAMKLMGSRIPQVGTERAGGVPNSLNLQPTPQVWTSIVAQYHNESDHDYMFGKQQALDAWTKSYARSHNLLLPNLFGNDAGSHQNLLASYGEESVRNLKAVSRKYDPRQVFQRLQNNGFLVSRV